MPSFAKERQMKNYRQYLLSPAWELKKNAYYAKHPKVCAGCGTDRRVDLHHLSYTNVGNEPFEDLLPLCRTCHMAVHRLHRKTRATLRAVTNAFVKAKQRRM